MKRLSALILAIFLILPMTMLSGCNQNTSNNDKISVVCTIFPQYDWVRQILGDKADNVELTLLLDKKIDLHSYQPSVEDIAKISACDLFIYVGGESDEWVDDVLKEAVNKDMVVINLLDVLGDDVKEEETVEGMEHDHDHSHSDEEIDPDNIGDRPLSYYAGNWVTIENALSSGAMDDYVATKAEENETDFSSQMSVYENRWQSEYSDFEITEDGLIIDGTAIIYEYVGYEAVVGDDSVTVWYGYEAVDTMGIAPKYIAFNDHTAETAEEHEHEDEDEHEHEEEALAHYHMRYGDESLAALVEIEGWAPTYFLESMTDEEVAKAMSGHSHSEGEIELDEHVWLSLKNAQTFVTYIAEALGELDTANSDLFQSNATAYNSELGTLDGEYADTVKNASINTLLFGDRFPFRYLVDDYGLDYYAAFSGCSAETEASFETIVFLAEKINELGLKNIMVTESSDQAIAKTIKDNSKNKDQQILVLNAMQSISSNEVKNGMTYITIMESNLNVLKDALK